jgi:hypothetical protein
MERAEKALRELREWAHGEQIETDAPPEEMIDPDRDWHLGRADAYERVVQRLDDLLASLADGES